MRDIRLDSDEVISASPPAGGAWVPSWPAPRGPRSWRLKRNCALRPGQYLAAIGLLMGISALVAIACWIRGIWLVPIFCCIELIGIAAAALAYARHAIDGEVVTLTEDRNIRVEVDRGIRHDAYTFLAQRLRVVRDSRDDLWLRDGGLCIQVGAHTSPVTRDMFEAELRKALAGHGP